MRLSELAAALGCELHGNGSLDISGVSGMEAAGPGELTFLANPKYAHKVKNTRAGAILISKPVDSVSAAQLISANPYHDFARALGMFYRAPRPAPGIHPTAAIAKSAKI